MTAPAVRNRSSWLPGARSLGFRPEGDGEGLHRIGMDLRVEGGWGTLSYVDRRDDEEAASRQMGRPGLWRRFAGGQVEFDVPPSFAVAGEVDLERLVDWALATADGRSPRGWRAPAESEVRADLEPEDLLARAGGQPVRGEIHRSRDRISIVFPQVVRLPEGLSSTRRAWIGALTADAQRRWRLVRIGPDAAGAVIRAEVDLTGAPRGAVGALVALGSAALRHALVWALPPIRLAADPAVRSRIFDNQPAAGDTRRKD